MNDATIEVNPANPADPVTPAVPAEPKRWGNQIFEGLTLVAALMVGVLFLLVAYVLISRSSLAIKTYGWGFLTNVHWNPVTENYGALTFIFGTVVTSAIALIIAVPLSVGTAIFLTDLAPLWLRQPLTSIVEMLAAVPSVIWGLWGLFVLAPWLNDNIYTWLNNHFGDFPLFTGPISASCILSAGIIVVAIMILPIVTSVFAGNFALGAGFAAGGGVWFGCDPLGSDQNRGAELRPARVDGRGGAGLGSRPGRNDGGHHGHRQQSEDSGIAVAAGLDARQRDREQFRRGLQRLEQKRAV